MSQAQCWPPEMQGRYEKVPRQTETIFSWGRQRVHLIITQTYGPTLGHDEAREGLRGPGVKADKERVVPVQVEQP